MRDKISRFLEGSSLVKIWLLVFLYVIFMSALVQFVILPHIFPQWHAGNGLILGTDSISFHKKALELSSKIEKEGWSAWVLRPYSRFPAGILAALYVIFMPHAFVMAPINAALHATSFVLLILIMFAITRDRNTSIISTLPFAFFPTALFWSTQIHKDGFTIAGSYLILYGFLALLDSRTWVKNLSLIKALTAIIIGFLALWLMRPYLVKIFRIMAIPVCAIITFRGFIFISKIPMRISRVFTVIASVWFIIFLAGIFTEERISLPVPAARGISEAGCGNKDAGAPQQPAMYAEWQKSRIIPYRIQKVLMEISNLREGSCTNSAIEAKTKIDVYVQFHNLGDMLSYIPRAMQIVFFSPFPRQWFEEASIPSNNIMRRATGMEMILVYLTYPFLVCAFWLWRRRIQLWVMLIYPFTMLILYSMIICNIGTLHRMRYGPFMLLVSLGIAAGAEIIARYLKKKKRSTCAV